ncbi:phosphoprotein associated with glycosphingolipid-enriched microdomains 1 [Hyla sarda]|uniref:phosphoprotein associated with glycosphingolipid-enriched microdomains 1 n=1 Tax=Hyla sarda TaxID=327740 RepID=UPI0024C3A6C2|nr:phosphoprotein associated with glycosphingolipid-enriched microdomains 1 [Hyla sarda]XP_056378197.1 phosphoprotein associated with glycosphingolipid-enriched microdomains 1 [Hyla sarda]XP_056378198.1 phosphoprotein associated with glycosphingolipid-enriched microdomains 1 [Hyla sarda]XP_056378199.1 phosphoprotein associated with glycosphingolipid-enriched microdomains 1 [Hyla sarda]XP_056378200.1 phosphoprotein associated with glycosphingolipid-enriched microdomains 1 [Hyla sarda]XP_0563782
MAPILQRIAGSWALSSEQVLLISYGGVAVVSTLLVITVLIFLCSSCDRGKKKNHHHQNGDHENLMNAPSDKETHSHSVTSLGTEAPASSYRNGAVSTGDVSEDSAATCVPTYEDVQSSLPDLCDPQDFTGKSMRCPQTRELPQIPPDNSLESASLEDDVPLYNEGPYEVLKDSSSHDNIIEDSLYETVKELKDISSSASAEEKSLTMNMQHLANAECKMEAVVEYASVDHNRKSRQSINTHSAASTPTYQDDDIPPPLPKKLLDENENVQGKETEEKNQEPEGGASTDDKRQSCISYKSREEDPCLTEDDISAMYSRVSRTGQSLRLQEDLSHYSYIQDVEVSPTTCNGTYATVRDLDKSPNLIGLPPAMDIVNGGPDPEYEAIATLTHEEDRTLTYSQSCQGVLQHAESDYESIGDLQQNGDYTRL